LKKIVLFLFTAVLLLLSSPGFAQTYYAKSGNGINLRKGPGTDHAVIMSIPQNGEMNVIKKENSEWFQVSYKGKTGYVHSQNLSDEKSRTQSSSSNSRSGSNQQRNTNSQKSSSGSSGFSGYTTSIGLRGGYTSGVSVKHFVNSNAALEVVLGSRWHGYSITAMYQILKGNALGIPGMSWEYGIGARAGFYDGRYYYKYNRGNCKDPYNRKCYSYYNYHNPNLTALGIVGIGGLEYQFKEIPFTVSLDLIPVFYINHGNRGFMDGSVSLRYIIK